MNVNDIAFPHLGIYLENVGKNVSVFHFSVAFYGMIIGFGILAGFFLAAREAGKRGMNPDLIWDFAVYGIIFSIIGGRAYFVLFSLDQYLANPLEIFNTRHGGMAIYGAVIAGFLTMVVYCKKKKVSFAVMADTLIMGLLLGQIIGRWGNFFNREAFGGYSDGLLAMRLPIEGVRKADISAELYSHIVPGTNYIQVHPTFLYESMWNLVALLIILLYRKHKQFEGEIFFLYIFLYGLGRFWIEGLRTDQLHIPVVGLPVSQLLAIVSAIVALVCILRGRKKAPKANYIVKKL